MTDLTRRNVLTAAIALGATAAWASPASKSRTKWRERRDLYPEGVASGDPDSGSVLLWTRRPYTDGRDGRLTVEVAEDDGFTKVVATARANALAKSDWTSRVLVGGLKPASEYFYRFTDSDGNGSRIGRTITAPEDGDTRKVQFAFVSCQNANQGAQNAYRRMIYEDKKAAPEDKLGFVLHLGDFIYELVWYPEDRPQGYFDRKITDIVRYEHGEKISDFHIPTTIADYRAVYKAYLHDPDIQDARAYLPFVAMWDNHEFSWQGRQSIEFFGAKPVPAQTRKVAANQAWFEIHPARIKKQSPSLDSFDPPTVVDTPVTNFDENGLGQEPNNLIAINSLTAYRALRYGANAEIIITDQRSYRGADPLGRDEASTLGVDAYSQFVPEELQIAIDAGRAANNGNPPATLKYGKEIPNFRKNEAPHTLLGAVQKAWLLDTLKASRATWKIWGNTQATLDMRVDPQNLPKGLAKTPWPGNGYAGFGDGDPATAYFEKAEIYDTVAREGITGFAAVAGDRHSFWAGLAAKSLPPAKFEPVGVAFVTGSISAPGMVEGNEHKYPKDDPLRPLFIADRPNAKPEATVNLMLNHGVRTALEYAKSGDIAKARALANPDNAPHVSFVDMGGHGYAIVRAAADRLDTEFVCIPRPIERSATDDGGPLRYRVVHSAKLWSAGEKPVLEQHVIEGDASLSI
jgi:alkaline phosphatase D